MNYLSPLDVRGQQRLDLRNFPCYTICLWFCFPNVQICAILAALNKINLSWCFVFEADTFLPHWFTRFDVKHDVVFIKDPPEFVSDISTT